jgi:uncharacterized protein YceK
MSPWVAKIACMGLVVAMAGCASSASSATSKEQHAKAVAQATAYCKKKGLVMRASNAEAPTRPGQLASDLQFHCVKAK